MVAKLDCQLKGIENPLAGGFCYLGLCLAGCFQRWLGLEGSGLMNGTITWWNCNMMALLGSGA